MLDIVAEVFWKKSMIFYFVDKFLYQKHKIPSLPAPVPEDGVIAAISRELKETECKSQIVM